MGRSVSMPSNCTEVCFGYLYEHRYECLACSGRFDEYRDKPVSYDDGHSEATAKACPHCGADEDETQEIDQQWEFDSIVESFDIFTEAFPSLSKCDSWLDREDHALLENRYCHIGISEYCGVVAVWLVRKDGPWYGSPGWEALRDRWLDSVQPRFEKLANSILPGAMVKLGTFSNGEAVFQRLST